MCQTCIPQDVAAANYYRAPSLLFLVSDPEDPKQFRAKGTGPTPQHPKLLWCPVLVLLIADACPGWGSPQLHTHGHQQCKALSTAVPQCPHGRPWMCRCLAVRVWLQGRCPWMRMSYLPMGNVPHRQCVISRGYEGIY